MGNVLISNKTHILLNWGLYVVAPYWWTNEVQPGYQTKYQNIGCVWYSIEILPWLGADSEITTNNRHGWHWYENYFPYIKNTIANEGEVNVGYFKLIGHNLTEMQVEERLHNLAFWGDGYYACGKKYCVTGGPSANAILDSRTIDITELYDPIRVYQC